MNKFQIDSFKLRIPIDRVTIVSQNLGNIIAEINKTTGEILSEKEKQSVVSNVEIPTQFTIEKQTYKASNGVNVSNTYLTIKTTAKHLRASYLVGISATNIEQVYNSLLNESVVTFNYNDFLSSEVTDIDYKSDTASINYKDLLEYIKTRTKAKIEYGKGISTFNKKHNKGFQFSSRETATNTNPYFKLYNKNLQCLSSSKKGMKDFALTYGINEQLQPDTYRFEFTIKNKKMFDYYKLPNTLNSLLELPPLTISKVASKILEFHLNLKPNHKPLSKYTDMNEILISELLNEYYNKGLTVYDLLNRLECYKIPSSTLSRNKEKIMNVYNEILTDKMKKIETAERDFKRVFGLE